MISHSNIENIYKESGEKDRVDNDYHKKYEERYQIGERQADEID